MESFLLPNKSNVCAITIKTFQWKGWGRNIAPAIRMSLPVLLSSLANLTSQKYKNFEFCFWGSQIWALLVQMQEVWEVQSWGSSADTDLEWLTPSKPKDVSVEFLLSRSVTRGYKGFTDQKPPFELHPETRSMLCCHVHAENTQLSTELPYPAPASAFKVI